jgi:hypothetical protein
MMGSLKRPYELKIYSAGYTHIGDEYAGLDISLYPNPATDKVYLNVMKEPGRDIMVEIIDMSGRKVYNTIIESTQKGRMEIDLKRFRHGVYYFKFYGKDFVHTEKLIVL